MRRRVAVLTTGGTIACEADPIAGALQPSASPLAEKVRTKVDLHWVPVSNVLGTALGPAELLAIANRAVDLLRRPDTAGVVVTAGTGILEEGAFLCELLNDTGAPIVWTGAQRSMDSPDGDGARNLALAARVASSPEARAAGARSLICFNDEIFWARDVEKRHATNVAAFSASYGPLGSADEAGVFWRRRVDPGPTYALRRFEADVDLIKLVSGSDSRFFRASLEAGARGIVVEAFPGTGVVCPGALEGIRAALRASVAVALAARSSVGRVISRYGTPLGAASLAAEGVLLGGDLSAEKLRILLMVVLSATGNPSTLSGAVEAFGR